MTLSVVIISRWLPDSYIEVIVALIGLVLGLVFGLSWRASRKVAELGKDPRVRSFKWAFAVFIITFIGDLKRLLSVDQIDKPRLLFFYCVFFVGAWAVVLAISASQIYFHCRQIRTRRPQDYPSEPFHPVGNYLRYGHLYYEEEFRTGLERKHDDKLVQLRNFSAEVAHSLAAVILAVDHYIQQGRPGEIQKLVAQRLLEHICLVVKANSTANPKPAINANYMLAVPWKKATLEQKKGVMFGREGHEYGHLLLLKEYAYPEGQEHFVLPVEDPVLDPDWADWTLPGAPEAFLRKTDLVVQTAKLDFADKLPKQIRKSMQDYFSHKKNFRSFASLIVPGPEGPRGIINVESSEEHVFQDAPDEIAKLLQPFCALLGVLLN